MSMSVPTDAMGVALNKYVPSMALNADNLGLIVQGCIMLSVMLHCSVMRHQLAMRNNGGVPALVAEK